MTALPPDYNFAEALPSPEEFCTLRVAVGLSAKSIEAARIGLPNSWYAVSIRHEDALIGMGRVIGDGGTAFQITDIAVHPAHQGKGLGKVIVGALVARLRSHAPASAYVSLIADGNAQFLYAKYGFEPVMPASIGMALRIG